MYNNSRLVLLTQTPGSDETQATRRELCRTHSPHYSRTNLISDTEVRAAPSDTSPAQESLPASKSYSGAPSCEALPDCAPVLSS